jgi:outer membrane protein assembly factor BamA
MKKSFVCFIALFLFSVIVSAQDETKISSVKIDGNKRIATETYLYYISVKAGDPYDEAVLQNDFKRLWQTGFLDDLKIVIEKTPQGVEVV